MKRVALVLILLNGISWAQEKGGLRDPMMPGGKGALGEVVLKDEQGKSVRNDSTYSHVQMIVLKEPKEKSWILVGGRNIFIGGKIFGDFVLSDIEKDGIYFKDVNQKEYYLAISKEHDFKTKVREGEIDE